MREVIACGTIGRSGKSHNKIGEAG